MPKDTTQGAVDVRLPADAARLAGRRGESLEEYACWLARRSAISQGRPVRVVDGGGTTGRPFRILAEAVPWRDLGGAPDPPE